MQIISWVFESVVALLFIHFLVTGKVVPPFILRPYLQRKRKKAMEVELANLNFAGRQLQAACVNQATEQAGERVERPNVYFGERFPNYTWDEAVKSLKIGWSSFYARVLMEYPELKGKIPHFSTLKPLESQRKPDEGLDVMG